jgi:CRP/FNR family cyclic AMP-dependent transcriptional regulator
MLEKSQTMAADIIIDALARLPIFEGLTPAQIREIGARAQRAIYHPGSVIIEENAEGDAAILIVSGEAARVSGPELYARIEPVAPGSLIGEASMLIETTHSSTVVARGEVRALQVTRDELRAQMLEDPSIAETLIHNISMRLIRMAEQLRQVDASLERAQAAVPDALPQLGRPVSLFSAPVH